MASLDKTKRGIIVEIFGQIQENVSNHQKNLQKLKAVHRAMDLEAFISEFMRCLEIVFTSDYKRNKERHMRVLTFVSQLCTELLVEYEKQTDSIDDDQASDSFLTSIVNNTLLYIHLSNVNCRFHSCQFISLLLDHVVKATELSSEICDNIQDALLDRLTDPLTSIRVLSVHALMRLQDPSNPNCPVINSFIRSCSDVNPLVRKEIITRIAVTLAALPKVIEEMRDVDHTVRLAAYKKVSSCNPRILKIIQRRTVVLNGIEEEHKAVKNVFQSTLLPNWLKSYNSDLMSFLSSLKLDADEHDMKETQHIYEQVLKVFFKTLTLNEVIQYIPLNEERLVPLEKINTEIATYWYYLITHLQEDEKLCLEVDSILVELTPLCSYIRSLIEAKKTKNMESWEYLEFQEVLYHLFRLAAISDLSEEVGRQNLQQLVKDTLINVKLELRVIAEIIDIFKMFIPDIDRQCEEICMIISDIREFTSPQLVSQVAPIEISPETAFKIAKLKLRVHETTDLKEEAIKENNFAEAEKLHQDIGILRSKIEELSVVRNVTTPELVTKEIKNDTETVCKCLDILLCFLQNTRIKALPASLRSCRIEFVKQCMKDIDIEFYGKIFRIVGQYCLLDKDIAMEDLRNICTPLLAHKFGKAEKTSLIASIESISDMIRVHGPHLFGDDSNTTSDCTTSQTSLQKSKSRKLFGGVQLEDLTSDSMVISGGFIMDSFLELLDEEDDDVRHSAVQAIGNLIANGLLVGSSLISRLLLKWLNPSIEKSDPRMQQIIGDCILHYAVHVKDSSTVIEKAVIPTLCCIGTAPRTGPFADLDVDSALSLLCNITRMNRAEFGGVHKNLAFTILHKINRKPTAEFTVILSKTLLFLDPPKPEDEPCIKELITAVEMALQLIIDKNALKTLLNYLKKLNALLKKDEDQNASDVNKENTNPEESAEENTVDSNLSNRVSNVNIEETSATSQTSASRFVHDSVPTGMQSTPIKRKRSKATKSKNPDASTTLHTIIESSETVERLADDDCSPTSTSSVKSTRSYRTRSSTRSSQVSTSDSDDETAGKRSKRLRKNLRLRNKPSYAN